MNSSRLRLTGLVLAVGVTAAMLAACKGDKESEPPLTLGAYVQTLVSLDQTHEGNAGPLREQLDREFAALSEGDVVPEGIIDTFNALADEDADFADAVDDLTPPAEAKVLHDEAVDALKDDHEVVKAVLDDIDDETTVGELNQRFAAQDVADAGRRRLEACVALQEFANEQGVSVNLAC